MFDKLVRRRLRLIYKGYKYLKDQKQSDYLTHLEEVLTTTNLEKTNLGLSCLQGVDEELLVRQYLTVRLLGLRFKQSVLYSIGSKVPLRYPLPKEWRVALTESGVDVDHFRSKFLWGLYHFIFFGKGVRYGLRSIYSLFSQNSNLGNYVYFDGLSNNLNGNCISNNPQSHNIINWYLRWENGVENIDSICHSVDNQSDFELFNIRVKKASSLPRLDGFESFKYTCLIFYLFFFSILSITSRPYRSFLLEERIKAIKVSIAKKSNLAKDYLFNNSSAVYRPLWTYVAKHAGSRVLFYFYSVNDEGYKQGEKYEKYNLLYLMSWSHYLAWDEFHVNFLRRIGHGNSIIEKVGVTWFSSSDADIDIPKNSIAVFDVTPRKYLMYVMYGPYPEYRTYDITNHFLSDIFIATSEISMYMAHKVKRINKSTSIKYLRRLRQLKEEAFYLEVHPSVDATQVIQRTKACISSPFTSTALIAKLEGKPSIYYDPTGMIQGDDRAAHGIPVITELRELRKWVEQLD